MKHDVTLDVRLHVTYLGLRKSVWPIKIEWWGAGVVICLEKGANYLHTVWLMSLPPCHLLLP